jgi:hypothetical protein
VSQYRYERGVQEADQTAARQYLNVDFSSALLEQALNARGIALWGRERPETLLWLAVDHAGQRFLLGSDVQALVHDKLLEAAENRALPLLLPLMDLQDERALQYSDVRGGFTERVISASDRYAADAVLTGHLSQLGDGSWRAEWALVQGARPVRWQSADRRIDTVLDDGMAGLARELAARFSVRGGGGGQAITLRVNRVDTLADYAVLQQNLARMPVVRSLQAERVSAGVVVFRVGLNGSAGDFERAVRLKRLLTPAPADLNGNAADLEYDLLKN